MAAGAPPSMVKRIKLHEKEDGLVLQVPRSIADRAPEGYQVSGTLFPIPHYTLYPYTREGGQAGAAGSPLHRRPGTGGLPGEQPRSHVPHPRETLGQALEAQGFGPGRAIL